MPFRYLRLTVNDDNPAQVDIHYVCKICGKISPPATEPSDGWRTHLGYNTFLCKECYEKISRRQEQLESECKLSCKIKKWLGI